MLSKASPWVGGSTAAGMAGGAGRVLGSLRLPARPGMGSGVGTGSHGRQAQCSGRECHAASVRGLTACISTGETQPPAPAVLRGSPARLRVLHHQQPHQEQPGAVSHREHNLCCNQSKRKSSRSAGDRVAAGSDPCSCSKISALLPEEREQAASVFPGSITGKPWERQLLMAAGRPSPCIKYSATNQGCGPTAHALSEVWMGVTHLGSELLASSSSES